MALSPDKRLFVTDMYNKTDNSRGVVYILDQFDPASHQFKKIAKYLSGLRNPNSIAFYTDASGVEWFYLALTDRLVRYRYERGKDSPAGEPEVLATFPDYFRGRPSNVGSKRCQEPVYENGSKARSGGKCRARVLRI